ncbi:MAG: ABC transporter permease [Elusimicrobia bacterium]|nr:MAG: ABC transporter permease [Elusimicrobiota bacterium]
MTRGRGLLYLLLGIYAALTLGPFLWSLSASFKTVEAVSAWPPTLIPRPFTLENYTYLLEKLPFLRWMFNSLVIAGIVTVANVFLNAMAGYALARLRFPGRKVLFWIIIGTMMIPGQVVIIPVFILLSKLGWIDSYAALTIPFLTSAFGVFMYRQFFLGVPKSLEEAAMLDGMGPFQTFFRIILPLAKPVMAAQAIFMFLGSWNGFMWPAMLLSTPAMYTLPVGLSSFQGQYYTLWNLVMAGTMFVTAPVVVVFIIFQRYFIQGVSTTGIK